MHRDADESKAGPKRSKITPYLWVHPDEERCPRSSYPDKTACKRSIGARLGMAKPFRHFYDLVASGQFQ